jgi:hypothetical protein
MDFILFFLLSRCVSYYRESPRFRCPLRCEYLDQPAVRKKAWRTENTEMPKRQNEKYGDHLMK